MAYRRALIALLLALALASPLHADDPPPGEPTLTLPAEVEADVADGFVEVPVETEATEVRWLVVGPVKPRFVELQKSVIVALPPPGQSLQVYAVGVLDGRLTPFARCVVSVRGARPPPGTEPVPPPKPDPTRPTSTNGKLFVTIVWDPAALTPEQARLMNDPTLRKGVQELAGEPALFYPSTAEVLKPPPAGRDLGRFVQRAGGAPAVIVQGSDGLVKVAERLPATAEEVVALVRRAREGK